MSARAVGYFFIDKSYKYKSKKHFQREYKWHQISRHNKKYKFISGQAKYGWHFNAFYLFDKPRRLNRRPGITFSRKIKTLRKTSRHKRPRLKRVI